MDQPGHGMMKWSPPAGPLTAVMERRPDFTAGSARTMPRVSRSEVVRSHGAGRRGAARLQLDPFDPRFKQCTEQKKMSRMSRRVAVVRAQNSAKAREKGPSTVAVTEQETRSPCLNGMLIGQLGNS